ncbi:MAG: hypothetical protein KIS94_12815 [Chitinophagales bacterium]|nr:hypothetical protein [Chitinophagales bacterium]
MNTKAIDLANIALMLLACVAAFAVPFEMFLFSYAVLGPLHYLTEIGWLHKRNYFATGKNDYLLLIAFCVLLFMFTFIFTEHSRLATVFIFVAFFFSLGTVLFKNFFAKLGFVALAFVVGAAVQNAPSFVYLIGVFLPTLIHVFLFTGLFILYGALKNKSVTGIASLVVFAVCAISFFLLHPNIEFYKVTAYAEKALQESGFIQLNKSIIEIFKLGQFTRENVFESNTGLGIMRFIAFAYTYHYLNWFSKTQVIKWHEVPKNQLAFIVVLWILSVALYAYDYYIGLVALYFLSMLHVLLEFPLNYRSVIGIGEEIGALAGWKKSAAKNG